jgi:hypothetical protein
MIDSTNTNAALPVAIPRHNGPVRPFEPAAVRYIKLGKNGNWATDALKEGPFPSATSQWTMAPAWRENGTASAIS